LRVHILGATDAAGDMERDDLGAEKVVARRDVGRDLEGNLAAVRVENVGAPVVLGHKPRLANLEPAGGPRGRGLVVIHLCHVDDDWAIVVATDGFVRCKDVRACQKKYREGDEQQLRSPGWACISTVTVSPAARAQAPAAGIAPFTLHARSCKGE
jgi:hypothetical protein